MPSWVDRFNEHQAWRTLEELRSALKDVTVEADADDERDTIEYATAVCERAAHYRTHGEPLSVTKAMLAGVESAARLVIDAITPWVEQRTDYKPVDAAVDGLVAALAALPPPTSEHEAAGASSAISKLSKSTDETLSSLDASRTKVAEKLTALETEQQNLEQRHTKLGSKLDATLTEQEKDWNEALTAARNSASEAVEDLRRLRDDAANMVNETTTSTVALQYDGYARQATTRALWYDGIGAAFGLGGLAVLFVFSQQSSDDLSVAAAFTRMAVTIGAITIGGFLGARGAVQHKEAREAKRTALALSRISPFIANLPPDAREILMIETADRIFTRGELGQVTERESVLRKLTAVRKQKAEAEAAADS